MAKNKGLGREAYEEAYRRLGSIRAVARELGVHKSSVQDALRGVDLKAAPAAEMLTAAGYRVDRPEKTPAEAWEEHKAVVERRVSKVLANRWPVIKRPKGPFVVAHFTDPHIDDDATPLHLLEADIRASRDLGAVICLGGDIVNNWPMAGRLAKLWAEQACTKADALLRIDYLLDLMRPDAVTLGNHEEMNPYLADLIRRQIPKGAVFGDWTANFVVQAAGGRPLRAILSHKFQKGSSYFHPHHGVLREGHEGEEADLYMEGHLHIGGHMTRVLPERGHMFLAVASAGYKIVDKFATRISRGGTIPKVTGRAHWIVCDPDADLAVPMCRAFEEPQLAEAYLNGLQNLRAA
jgi:hypothetical protein